MERLPEMRMYLPAGCLGSTSTLCRELLVKRDVLTPVVADLYRLRFPQK